ncbi:MAG: GDSL-type esterase/lipase family protein [Myxococcota bacterium]
MRAALRPLLTLLVATLVSLGICEVLVRAFVVVRNVGPSFTVYDAVYGKRLRPSFSTTRIAPEFTMRFTTNSLGFRGPEPTTEPTGAIVFLGDSFTMGYGVSDGEEFPALVAERLRESGQGGIPVVNAGTGDTGNGRWLKLLRAEAPRYAPRLVVLQVHANDFADNPAEGLFALAPDGALVELPPRPPGITRTVQQLVEAVPGLSYSHLLGLAKQLSWRRAASSAGDAPASSGDDPSEADRLTLALLAESVRVCREQGWPVLVLLADVAEPQASWLRATALDAGAALVEIPTKSARPDLYFALDGHWTTAGHVYTTRRILERLTELGLPGVPGAAESR